MKELSEMSKKKETTPPQYQVLRRMRGDWGEIKPVTKVIPNKKKNPKTKHKGREWDE